MKSVGKSSMVNRLEQCGFSFKEAEQAVDIINGYVADSLMQGDRVVFHNNFSITPKVKKATTMKVAGETRPIPERLTLNISTSRTLAGKWYENFSPEAKAKRGLREIGRKLSGE